MSLTTRCPACQTLFKLVPDQLRISEGWVRCGQCNEVFDASLQLLSPEAIANPGANKPAPALPAAGPGDSAPSGLAPISVPVNEALVALPETAQALIQFDPNDLEDPDRKRSTELGESSFLQTQQNTSAWRKPLARILLLFMGLSLLLGLAGQVVFHERNRIIALQPGLKGLMLMFCGSLNCSLSALQLKDAVVIDGASFTKIRPDAYRLNFTLRNTAATAVAAPAIELTLTDSLDQPVVRRIFVATELGIPSNTLARASEWTAAIALELTSAGTAERIVGYRLLAFYP
jgi:predicted Zn finger-like uncharacterized protein